eukprot:TRINITY_DN42359_c0_g1_i1.p1 TRINITY_DN42359_c0_g1~~TRINITY_DN42359_c0_g1_i1.p1  ORF type:complete len:452 (-),score=60.17 TRINITY_DN42359_c0_g1_i1:177-1532(-)
MPVDDGGYVEKFRLLNTEANSPGFPMPAKPEASPAKPKTVQIPHLTGVRTLIAMWILCHHMAHMEPYSSLDPFVMRVDTAVEFFMILSGFVTQHAYGSKDVTGSFGSLMCFYVRRLTRVCLTTQLAMLWSIAWWLWGASLGAKSIAWALSLQHIGCLVFVTKWINPLATCPNGPTWFVTALIPSWLVFPLVTQKMLAGPIGQSAGKLVAACVLFWVLAIGPQLLCMSQRQDWMSWEQVGWTWFWPPAQLADFAFGCCLAALVKQAPPPAWAGWLADAAILFVLAVCLTAPVAKTPLDWTGEVFRPGHYIAWDGLEGRLAAPFLAVFIYCSCSSGFRGIIARFCTNPAFTSLAPYALEVYLFQTPLHNLFVWCKDTLWLPKSSNEVFVAFVITLWFFCAAFVEWVADPWTKWLRDATEDWNDKPMSYFLRRSRYSPAHSEGSSEWELESREG